MLEGMILDQFKGVLHGEYNFHDLVNILKGPNGSGKSTVFDALIWTFKDKDSKLQAGPEIHNTGLVESEPSVTIIWNNPRVVFRKYQVDMRTKKQKEEGAPLRIANKYEINSVPKTQKDFEAEIRNMGIDIDNFLYFVHTEALLRETKATIREFIFQLAGEISDAEIAETMAECGSVRELLQQYKADEIVAMNKATIKRCNDHEKAIPNQIIGLEKAKVPVDPNLAQRIEQLKRQIDEMTGLLETLRQHADTSTYENEIRQINIERTTAYNEANAERLKKLNEAQGEINSASAALQEAKNELNSMNSAGRNINEGFRSQKLIKSNFEAQLEKVKAETFSVNDVCPTCGQKIPEEQIESARAKWQEQHDAQIKSFEDRIRTADTLIASYTKDGKGLAAKKKEAEQKVAECEAALETTKEAALMYSTAIYPDLSLFDARIAEVKAKKQAAIEAAGKARSVNAEIGAARLEYDSALKMLAQQENNDRINTQIRELREAQAGYVQSRADAENILYQMELIGKRKNELLSGSVNSHFTRVKWRLFVTQKNGEVKDDCTPMVLCQDGQYRDMTFSANTAAIQAAKIDICRGLQKFYNQDLPIWLDGAECFDEKNREALSDMGVQLVLLCVSDEGGLVQI